MGMGMGIDMGQRGAYVSLFLFPPFCPGKPPRPGWTTGGCRVLVVLPSF